MWLLINDYTVKGYVVADDDILASAPIFLVPKKEPYQYRLVHDLRAFNKLFHAPSFQLPSPLAPLVSSYRFAGKIDIKECFMQFRVSD